MHPDTAVSILAIGLFVTVSTKIIVQWAGTGKIPLAVCIWERVGLLFLGVVLGVAATMGSSDRAVSPVNWFGVILSAIGLGIIIISYIQMGRSFRIGIDANTKDKLITKGIFSLSRNPIYLGIDCIFLGFLLTRPSFLFLVAVTLILPGVHFQILAEEKFLRAHYGREFEEYCKKTARYFKRPVLD